MRVSVIIPALNAGRYLPSCLRSFRRGADEVIVADGGSTDDTRAVAQSEGAIVIEAPPGRGRQLNAGAQHATGDIVLFLHADTVLPPFAVEKVKEHFHGPDHKIAKFRMRFDHEHWLLRIYSFMTRFDSVWTSFGDQCIIVRRSFFERTGGFPDWPLFEDVHFFRQARRLTKVRTLPLYVCTSAERFIDKGFVRQQLRNARLICRYLRGVSPEKLAQEYSS